MLPGFGITVASFGDILPILGQYITVLLGCYYFFAVIGMHAFGGGALAAANPPDAATAYAEGGLYNLNFENLASAFMVLFYVMALNDWPIITVGVGAAFRVHAHGHSSNQGRRAAAQFSSTRMRSCRRSLYLTTLINRAYVGAGGNDEQPIGDAHGRGTRMPSSRRVWDAATLRRSRAKRCRRHKPYARASERTIYVLVPAASAGGGEENWG
jgi:hypothetical protein